MQSNASFNNQDTQYELQKAVDIYCRELYPNSKIPLFEELSDRHQQAVIDFVTSVRQGQDVPTPRKSVRAEYMPRTSGDDGYVYFIQSEMDHEQIKIGWTNFPADRIAKLQIGSPARLSLLYLFKGRVSKKTETEFHKYFANKRIRGEWFRLTSHDLDKVESDFHGLINIFEMRFDRIEKLKSALQSELPAH